MWYSIKYRILYDKDKQFISGTFGVCSSNLIDCDSVIASNPTAKYIGIDLIDPSESGSGTTKLTIENTADWVVVIKSKYSEKIVDLDTSVTALDTRVTTLENSGDAEKKKTGLWLEGLPNLEPTKVVQPVIIHCKSGVNEPKWHMESMSLPPKERSRVRSQTFQGIANAMAIQWGKFIENNTWQSWIIML